MKAKLLFILSLFIPLHFPKESLERMDQHRIAFNGSQIESARASLRLEEFSERL